MNQGLFCQDLAHLTNRRNEELSYLDEMEIEAEDLKIQFRNLGLH